MTTTVAITIIADAVADMITVATIVTPVVIVVI